MPSTIKRGSIGPDVELAQYELCRTLYLGGPSDVDGDFGPHTDQAVRRYQTDNGLAVDGVVGPNTWGKMLNTFPQPPILAIGNQWPHIVRLQNFLNTAHPPANPKLVEDDIFGRKTEGAVKAYQAARGLAADGIVGYKTLVIHDIPGNAENTMVGWIIGV